jgi:hypothetical protein
MGTALLDELVRGRAIPSTALSSMCDDEFDGFAEAFAAVKRALAASDLVVLDEARRREAHVRHGARDVATWMARLSGERRSALHRDVALAEQVAQAPVVAGALENGFVSKTQAAALVAAAGLPDDVQEELVAAAGTMPVERLADQVREARLSHGDPVPEPRQALDLAKTDTGGTVTATLLPLGFEIVDTALRLAVERLGQSELPLRERRAEALVGICRFFTDHVDTIDQNRTTPAAQVLVITPIETLEARVGRTARLASGTVLRGEDARMLACDADISRVITGGASAILDVGRTTRSISPAIARAVVARDRHCTHPGCSAPPWACQIHHIVHYGHGGHTKVENLRLLCWFHHRQLHATESIEPPTWSAMDQLRLDDDEEVDRRRQAS